MTRHELVRLTAVSLLLIAMGFAFGFLFGYAYDQTNNTAAGPDSICHTNLPRPHMTWRISLPSGDTWASGKCP